MKTSIYFILIASILFYGCSKGEDDLNSDLINNQVKLELENQLNAQSSRKVTTAHTGSFDYGFDLWCGNDIIDRISGTLNYHCVMQQFENDVDDVYLFMNMSFDGILTGETTGEVFRYKEITTYNPSKDENTNFHINIIGDKGSHIILSGQWLIEAPWIAIDKAKCKE